MGIKNAFQVHVASNRGELDAKRAAFLRRRGLIMRPQQATVEAYVNDNRWVADCPECGSGIALLEDDDRACCWECGFEWGVVWPDPAVQEEGVEVLEERPPQARNWRPDRESVEQLRAENATMLGGR